MTTHKKPDGWRPRTLAVRGGQMRTPFQETAEPLFLTSGYAYESAEEAEARFKGAPGFMYTRYGNPTTANFEARIAALEGASVARATASGMAAVTAAFLCYLRHGDHVIAAKAMFGACRYVIEDVLARRRIPYRLVGGIRFWERREVKDVVAYLRFCSNPCNDRRNGINSFISTIRF